MSDKLNCVIIDDEKHGIELLSDYIDELPNLTLLKYYTDPLAAYRNITWEDNIDIIFLDIDMPGMTGIELARMIRNKSKFLVITTAHTRYAVEAFGIYANDYLLKPISLNNFAIAINKMIDFDKLGRDRIEPKSSDFFFIKTDQSQKYIKVNLKDLVAVEGLNNYVKIHTVNAMYVVYLTIKEVEHKLVGDRSFIRVQRSFIISMDHVNKIEGSFITLNNNLEVPLGSTYKKQFLSFLEDKTLRSNRGVPE
jgi:two-component system LytT family response regulator